MSDDLNEDYVKRKVRQRLLIELDKMVNPLLHGYRSKAYRAYVGRIKDFYCPPQPRNANPFKALGEMLVESMMDRVRSPGFMRLMLSNDPQTLKWKREQAEIKEQVHAVMSTVLPYSRHLDYKHRVFIFEFKTTPHAKYKENFVEPTQPFPEDM